jgi:molybdenum cofactor sulfurtransferase
MCNPGGAIAILGIQCNLANMQAGATLKDFEMSIGHELGVVRISLGLGSSFEDAWKLVRFAATLGNEASRRVLWERWKESLLPARNTNDKKLIHTTRRKSMSPRVLQHAK